ncbi:Uncharacterised protein [Bordetella pertussis]|nr:Uncharacterised protein [Bordetella pertussis]
MLAIVHAGRHAQPVQDQPIVVLGGIGRVVFAPCRGRRGGTVPDEHRNIECLARGPHAAVIERAQHALVALQAVVGVEQQGGAPLAQPVHHRAQQRVHIADRIVVAVLVGRAALVHRGRFRVARAVVVVIAIDMQEDHFPARLGQRRVQQRQQGLVVRRVGPGLEMGHVGHGRDGRVVAAQPGLVAQPVSAEPCVAGQRHHVVAE